MRRIFSMKQLRIWAAISAFAFVLTAQEPPPNPRANTREFLGLGPAPDAAAAKLGEPLYAANCAACHGKEARGAQGPNLLRSPLVLHDEKGEEIGQVIKKGRAEGGMPAFPDLSDVQTYDIAEFIHMQVELAANRGTYRDTYGNLRNQVTGDAGAGKMFFQANCVSCHSAEGDLAGVGKKYPQPSVLLTRIAWPVSKTPEQATVVTRNGATVSGVLLKYDDFDVALRDAQGEYHAWPRELVKVEVPDKLAGHRALLGKYSDSDLHNLTAYLVTLQ
jgi:mono/diheme cytochrome c family protein